jgi:hypothetical protein
VRHASEPVVGGEGHVDDRPAAGRPERELGREPGHPLRRADVHPRDRAPALRLDRLGGREVLAAGVVDERVEASAAVEREADDPLGGVWLADVAGDVVEPELPRRIRHHLLPAAADHDLRAAPAQLGRGGPAEPRSPAGYEHGAVGEQPLGEDLRPVHQGGESKECERHAD